MNSLLTDHFAALSTRGKVLATYIWLGGSGSDLREATKVLSFRPSCPEEVPLWTCDGTATGQEDAVVYLKACSVHPDPIRCAQRAAAHQRPFPSAVGLHCSLRAATAPPWPGRPTRAGAAPRRAVPDGLAAATQGRLAHPGAVHHLQGALRRGRGQLATAAPPPDQ